MILTCPACETQYFADDSTIGSEGRSVSCAACGHAWFVRAVGETDNTTQSTPAAHERYLEMVRNRRKKRSRATSVIVWLVSGSAFAATIIAAVMLRDDVARAWPQSASIYRAVGLDVNSFGLDFENVERKRELKGTMPVLSVAADVRNVTRSERDAPTVRVGLLDDYGREIAFILADIEPARIASGEAGRFEAILENPPVDSYSLSLRFIAREDAVAIRAQAQRAARSDPGQQQP